MDTEELEDYKKRIGEAAVKLNEACKAFTAAWMKTVQEYTQFLIAIHKPIPKTPFEKGGVHPGGPAIVSDVEDEHIISLQKDLANRLTECQMSVRDHECWHKECPVRFGGECPLPWHGDKKQEDADT